MNKRLLNWWIHTLMNRWGDESLRNGWGIHTWIHHSIQNTKMFHGERNGKGRERGEERENENTLLTLYDSLYLLIETISGDAQWVLMEKSPFMDYSRTNSGKGTQERKEWRAWFISDPGDFHIQFQELSPFAHLCLEKKASQEKTSPSWGRIASPEEGGAIFPVFRVKNSRSPPPNPAYTHPDHHRSLGTLNSMFYIYTGMQPFSWAYSEEFLCPLTSQGESLSR